MYGDTEVIRHLARQMAEQAVVIRERAEELQAQAAAVVWRGAAADAMRERMADRAVRLRRAADHHDDAARALHRHADEVDELTSRIAEIAARVSAMVDGARLRLAALGERALDVARDLVPDPLDEALARFVPPPPGHLDWLEVPRLLPGTGR